MAQIIQMFTHFRPILGGYSLKSFLIPAIANSTLFLSLIFNSAVCAETWEQTYGGSESGSGNCIQSISGGGYAVIGETSSYGAGATDAWLMKTDSKGIKVWANPFGGPDSEEGSWGLQTIDNGYIITGRTNLNGNRDGLLIKIDVNGNQEWSKALGGIESDSFNMVQEVADGYILCGFSDSISPGGGYWLVKTNKNGTIVWNKVFNDPRPGGQDEVAEEVWKTSDGGFVIFGATDVSGGETEYWDLIKTDANGDQDWWKRWERGGDFRLSTTNTTSDGGTIIVGYNSVPISPYGFENKVWIEKLDQNGNRTWKKNYDYVGNAVSILETDDLGIIILCLQNNNPNPNKILLIKTDSNGNPSWSKSFDAGAYPSPVYPISITESANGGFAILASSETFTPSYDSKPKIIYYKRPEYKGMNPAIPALLLSD